MTKLVEKSIFFFIIYLFRMI